MKKNAVYLTSMALACMLSVSAASANDCEAAETNQEMAECLNASYETADYDLNFAYQELLVAMEDTPAADQLQTAQRTWVKFRDQACKAEASFFEGGSAMRLVRLDCLARVTWSRVADLNVLLELIVGVE